MSQTQTQGIPQPSTCKKCGASIYWLKSKSSGNNYPANYPVWSSDVRDEFLHKCQERTPTTTVIKQPKPELKTADTFYEEEQQASQAADPQQSYVPTPGPSQNTTVTYKHVKGQSKDAYVKEISVECGFSEDYKTAKVTYTIQVPEDRQDALPSFIDNAFESAIPVVTEKVRKLIEIGKTMK